MGAQVNFTIWLMASEQLDHDKFCSCYDTNPIHRKDDEDNEILSSQALSGAWVLVQALELLKRTPHFEDRVLCATECDMRWLKEVTRTMRAVTIRGNFVDSPTTVCGTRVIHRTTILHGRSLQHRVFQLTVSHLLRRME